MYRAYKQDYQANLTSKDLACMHTYTLRTVFCTHTRGCHFISILNEERNWQTCEENFI